MSVNRLFHWQCDKCGKEVLQKEYGLPHKWIVLPRTFKRDSILHYCEVCNKEKEDE